MEGKGREGRDWKRREVRGKGPIIPRIPSTPFTPVRPCLFIFWLGVLRSTSQIFGYACELHIGYFPEHILLPRRLNARVYELGKKYDATAELDAGNNTAELCPTAKRASDENTPARCVWAMPASASNAPRLLSLASSFSRLLLLLVLLLHCRISLPLHLSSPAQSPLYQQRYTTDRMYNFWTCFRVLQL